MPNTRMIKAVLKEYGIPWTANRLLYSIKLKMMRIAPPTEMLFEKRPKYPQRLDLFQIDLNALTSFIRGLSDKDKAELIETADKACESSIIGFSSTILDYGNPIDWQLSPITGKRSNENQKWYQIPDFDKERGDIKVIWEASRFSHFITLARAFMLTENKKYYYAFSEQLNSWLKKNPYGYGANFKCSQECSLRMVNTLLAFTVFKNARIVNDADTSNVRDLIDRCYRKVLSNFFYAYKCIKNNHTISELMGMIVGAWCCKDQRQLEKAYKWLNEVIDEQFMDDGGYCQFSFNYERLVLQDLECVLSIEKKTGKNLSDRSKEKIKNAAILMYQCQDESGDVPNYGYNDGALVFPLTSCGYRDYKPAINTVYALVTGKQLYISGKHQEELIWFSAGKLLNQYELQKIERQSSQFIDAGLFTIRQSNSWMMIVSNEYHTRPAHMDQGHVDLWVDGVNVLCDAGTYSYASEIGKRLIRSENHNTAFVQDVSQMNTHGPFMIYDWPRRKIIHLDDTCFEGKTMSANGYSHVRRVKQIGASYEITDQVNKDYKIAFHTPCEVSIEGNKALLFYKGNKLCEIKSNGRIERQISERSPFYVKKDVSACLLIDGHYGTDIKTIIEIAEGE